MWLRRFRLLFLAIRQDVAQMICGVRAPRGGHVGGCRRAHYRRLSCQHYLKLVYPYQTFTEEIVANAFE